MGRGGGLDPQTDAKGIFRPWLALYRVVNQAYYRVAQVLSVERVRIVFFRRGWSGPLLEEQVRKKKEEEDQLRGGGLLLFLGRLLTIAKINTAKINSLKHIHIPAQRRLLHISVQSNAPGILL